MKVIPLGKEQSVKQFTIGFPCGVVSSLLYGRNKDAEITHKTRIGSGSLHLYTGPNKSAFQINHHK